MDTTASPDLKGLETTPAKLDIVTCAKFCTDEGYAYMGYKAGKKCLCDNTYAHHGVSNSM